MAESEGLGINIGDLAGFGSVANAGASVLTGIMSMIGGNATNRANAQSTREANLTNMMMANNATQFNADEAARTRAFNRDSQSIANDFTRSSQIEQERYQSQNMDIAMGYNTRERQEAQAYQTQMANTAWQRGVADMRAAGINPILAASKGAASSPDSRGQSITAPSGSALSGTSASGVNATAGHFAGASSTRFQNALGDAVTTALQAMGVYNENTKLQATLQNTAAHTDYLRANADQVRAQTEQATANTALTKAHTLTAEKEPALREAQTRQALSALEVATAQVANLHAAAGLSQAQATNAREMQKQLELTTKWLTDHGRESWTTNAAIQAEQTAKRITTWGQEQLNRLRSGIDKTVVPAVRPFIDRTVKSLSSGQNPLSGVQNPLKMDMGTKETMPQSLDKLFNSVQKIWEGLR